MSLIQGPLHSFWYCDRIALGSVHLQGVRMKNEWVYTFIVSFAVGTFLLTQDAAVAAVCGWISLLGGVLFLGYVWSTGCTVRKHRRALNYEELLETHRWHIAILTLLVVVGVVGIEIAVRKVGGLWGNSWFVILHLFFVLGTALSFLIARFWHTGAQSSEKHRRFAYTFMSFYIGAFTTGSILIEQKFKFYGSLASFVAKGG